MYFLTSQVIIFALAVLPGVLTLAVDKRTEAHQWQSPSFGGGTGDFVSLAESALIRTHY